MSMFYGQVSGQAETSAGRRGSRNSGIRSSAQSYDGSVIVVMKEKDGKTRVEIEISDDTSFYGERVFSGTIDELKMKLKGGE